MSLDKILKALNSEVVEELNGLSEEDLRKRIVQAEQAIKLAKTELEENPKYRELKESLKALRGGFTDLKKYQNAQIQYCLLRLEEQGK